MSIYTDWFIASTDDAESIANSDDPFNDWPSLSIKSVGEMEMMELWSWPRTGSLNDYQQTTGRLLYQGSDEGPFVCPVAPEFVKALAGLSQVQQVSVAAAWSQSEQWRQWPVSPDVVSVLHDLAAFGRQSTESEKPILTVFTL